MPLSHSNSILYYYKVKIPRPIEKVIESFEALPGIGPKTAERLAFYLLHVPQSHLDNFSFALSKLKTDTKMCSICKNITDKDPCDICSNESRDKSTICVVETPLDLYAIERAGFKGLYHVLYGAINPLQNIGPDELFISDLIKRLKSNSTIKEIILATNPTMEGETTAFYIQKLTLKEVSEKIEITRIGRGLPTGASLEYADETTLAKALEGRRPL